MEQPPQHPSLQPPLKPQSPSTLPATFPHPTILPAGARLSPPHSVTPPAVLNPQKIPTQTSAATAYSVVQPGLPLGQAHYYLGQREVEGANVPAPGQVMVNADTYNRIIGRKQAEVLRPSYRYFGSGVGTGNSGSKNVVQVGSYSNSPDNRSSHSYSLGKAKPRVNFFYGSPRNLVQTTETRVIQQQQVQQVHHIHQQIQQIPQQIPQQIQAIQVVQPQVVQTITTTSIVNWQRKFISVYIKFQVFVQRFEYINEQINFIDELFDNVNDEQAWAELRNRYTEMIQRFSEMREGVIQVLEENKNVVDYISPELRRELEMNNIAEESEHNHETENEGERGYEGAETGKSDKQANNVDHQRFLEMLEQNHQLKDENNRLREQIDRLNIMGHDHNSGDEQSKLIEMQKKFNTFNQQYRQLQTNYNKLSEDYSRVVQQLQNSPHMHGDSQISQLHQQLQMAEAKINQLYAETQEKNHQIEMMGKQLENYQHLINEHNELIGNLNKMQETIEYYEKELNQKSAENGQYGMEIKRLQEKISAFDVSLNQKSSKSNQDIDVYQTEIQTLTQKCQTYSSTIHSHERTIEQLSFQNQQTTLELQTLIRDKEDKINILNRYLEEERQERKRLSQNASFALPDRIDNISQTAVFKERLQVEIEEIVSEKNRKIKLLTQDLEDMRVQVEQVEKDKNTTIRQIKAYFAEQQEKYIKKVQDKENNMKLLQERIKSFESELSSRNLQISRFRHQPSGNSLGSSSDQTKKFNEALERKNYEMQQLRKTLEQKSLSVKQLEQKIFTLEQEINGKVFEVSTLKREIFQLHNTRAEVDNLNNIIKKKNQEINEYRLNGIQADQLRLNIDSLEREKIRLNEYLKQKSRECEAKQTTIQNLERKLAVSVEYTSTSKGYSNYEIVSSAGLNNNFETQLRQKQTEVKNLKYELEMLETKINLSEKTVRDLNAKIASQQKSASVLKAENENRVSRYESEIKELNKEIRNLKANKQQLSNLVESLQMKNSSLQKSLDERNNIFDREIGSSKYKISEVEKSYNLLIVDQEILRSETDRLTKQNRELNSKIISLQDKIESKNNSINEVKLSYQKKQREDAKAYEEKMKKLDGELKLSSVKIKKLEEQIASLNKKITSTEQEKRSYKQRLITQGSGERIDYFDLRVTTEHYETGNNQILQMDRFRLKDPQANDVFERKVIYDLKRQNDYLRKQLSGMGLSSFSMNRLDTQNRMSYQQEIYTDRDHRHNEEHNNQILSYHKNKNKELEGRIDDLLRVNNQLKDKLAVGGGSAGQSSVEFYKQQIVHLQGEVDKLQVRIKQLLAEHQSYKDQALGYQHQEGSLNQKLASQNQTINELKNTIRTHEQTITQLQNGRNLLQAEIERLKELAESRNKHRDDAVQKDQTIGQLQRKQRSLQEQIARLTNKISIQQSQIQRLNETLRSRKSQFDSQFGASSQQTSRLKRTIQNLQQQLQHLRQSQSSLSTQQANTAYRLQLIRSYFAQIDVLAGEILTTDRRSGEIIKLIRKEVGEGFTAITMIQI